MDSDHETETSGDEGGNKRKEPEREDEPEDESQQPASDGTRRNEKRAGAESDAVCLQ